MFLFYFCFALTPSVLAGSIDYQRCEPDNDCLLGEYVFDNDGNPVGQQACTIYIKNPSGGTVAENLAMSFESDGWHSYTFSSSGPEGLYRSLMCCTVDSDSACLDKSFVLGTSFESLNDIQADTQFIRKSTFDFIGLADAGSTNATLIDAELTETDNYWNNYTLAIMTGGNAGEERSITDFDSASHTLSFSAFPQTINANDKYVLRRDSRLIFGIWNSADRTLTSAVNVAGDIWNNSTRTLSSIGSLASDFWSDSFAPTRSLTSKSLSGGENLSTESDSEALKNEIVTQIGTTETNLSSVGESLKDELVAEIATVDFTVTETGEKVDEVLIDLENIEGKIDALSTADSGIAELIEKWGDYNAEELVSKLNNIYEEVEKISTAEIDDKISDLSKKVNENLDETKSLQNKAIEIRAMIALNRSLIENKPTVKTFYEWGSVVLKMVAANPSETKQIIEFRSALPKEIKPEDVINKSEGLRLEFDAENDRWFATASVELAGKKSETKFVEVRDIWKISDEEMESLRRESEGLAKPLENTAFFAQSVTIQNDINARLDKVKMIQGQDSITPEEHIMNFRENKIEIETVKKDLENLKKLVSDTSSGDNFKGSLLGVSTTMTWSIILMVIVGVGVLLIFLVVALRGRNEVVYERNENIDFKNMQKGVKKKTAYLPEEVENISNLPEKKILFKRIAWDALIFIVVVLALGAVFLLYRNRGIFSSNQKNNVELKIENKPEESIVPEENIVPEEVSKPEEDIMPEDLLAEPIPEKGVASQDKTSVVEKIKIKETETGWLNVREEPSLEAKILEKVLVGDELESLEKQEDWIKIKTKDGKEGWVSDQYVEIMKNE